MSKLTFAGRVVVVTGAGGGLGREYALLFGSRGAAVVVNDLGGSRDGTGAGSKMADRVVSEITSKGGVAVANYDSVEHGERIVETAIRHFGRIDCVVNNAGILRDKSFLKMTDSDWDVVQKVHLRGSYSVTKAAWPHMKKQNYGRIIMTSSTSGVYGNFGQANYGSAKTGVIGLSNVLAIEGQKYNIHSNVVVPYALSRLTEDILPEEIGSQMSPHHVAPLVAFLCHEACPSNGQMYMAGGGWYGRLKTFLTKGAVLSSGSGMATPEQVRDAWDRVECLNDADAYESGNEAVVRLLEHEQNGDDNSPKSSTSPRGGVMNRDVAKGFKFEPKYIDYTENDAILYALGVGTSLSDASNLKYLYEGHEAFSVLPTFVVKAGFTAGDEMVSNDMPGVNFDLTRVLHGEEYVELFEPLPTSGRLRVETEIGDLLDKKSGALLILNITVYNDASNARLARLQVGTFLVGLGGFGAPSSSDVPVPTVSVPQGRQPDAVVEQRTALDQAALYRLGGSDPNPLHVDPAFAQMAGFKQPILHGLCTFGYSVRHVIQQYGGNDSSVFKAAKVKENGDIVIGSAYVDLNKVEGASPIAGGIQVASSSLKSDEVFKQLRERVESNPDIVKRVKAVYLWVINKDGKEAARYTMDLKSGSGSIYSGEPKDGAKAGVTLTIDDDNMVKLITGKLNPQQAFMSGKLKIKGNVLLTQKLQSLLKDQAKL